MVVATPGYVDPQSSDSQPPPASPVPDGVPKSSRPVTRRFGELTAAILVTALVAAGAYALWPEAGTETPVNVPVGDVVETAVATDTSKVSDIPVLAVERAEGQPTPDSAEQPKPVAKPSPARLTVLVSPWGNVWINGRDRGTAPLKAAALRPGRYKVSAGQGTPSRTKTVKLASGQRNAADNS